MKIKKVAKLNEAYIPDWLGIDIDDDEADDEEIRGIIEDVIFSEADDLLLTNYNIFEEPSVQADEGTDVFYHYVDDAHDEYDWKAEVDFAGVTEQLLDLVYELIRSGAGKERIIKAVAEKMREIAEAHKKMA